MKSFSWRGPFALIVILLIVAIIFLSELPRYSERQLVYGKVSEMMESEGILVLNNPAVKLTNDMAGYPSAEHPLFPKYLPWRYAENSYRVEYTFHQAD